MGCCRIWVRCILILGPMELCVFALAFLLPLFATPRKDHTFLLVS